MSDKASEMRGGVGEGGSKRYSQEGGRKRGRTGGKMQMWRRHSENMMMVVANRLYLHKGEGGV